MMVDRKQFYDTLSAQFHLNLTQSQINGYNAILEYWEASCLFDLRWLAYMLATVYHETGRSMVPVREYFGKTDADSIRAVTELYNRGKITKNYAKPEANGNSYFGRGLVQLTWAENYKRMGQALGMGVRLYDNPSLALDLGISVQILFNGMINGLFTKHRLVDYFNTATTDWVRARRIINSMDKAELIADYARRFKVCLNQPKIAVVSR